MGFWAKLSNFGIDSNNYSDWDERNIRLMNSMNFILACAMIFFVLMGLIFKIYAALIPLAIAFTVTLSFFVVIKFTSLLFAKLFFCLIPILIVSMFAILIVGEAGNDKYFLFVCSLIPLIIFKEKKFYLPIFSLSIVAFFAVSWIQTIILPARVLPNFQLQLYININAVVIFTFIIFLLNFFKKEIFGYQREIELQKELIEEHNNEVKQSIEYAKKIQDAILPSKESLQSQLPNSFVLYEPKDIVAGDFYWTAEKNDLLFFAAADCTGHGVPGAMVSVICCNALNRAVNEFNIAEPGKILDKTRELVIQTFQQSNREVKDGMDIGLCSLNLKTKELLFAGANNGLYLVSKSDLIEYKPDKQPIGNFENAEPFNTQEIKCQRGDLVYLFTDGFADQFGGEKGKKYKYKPFKELLIKLSQIPIQDQSRLIAEEFRTWRGDLEQIDDVCIFGVKI